MVERGVGGFGVFFDFLAVFEWRRYFVSGEFLIAFEETKVFFLVVRFVGDFDV